MVWHFKITHEFGLIWRPKTINLCSDFVNNTGHRVITVLETDEQKWQKCRHYAHYWLVVVMLFLGATVLLINGYPLSTPEEAANEGIY